MNEIIKQLYDRKSVRVFLDKNIDINIKNEIINSAIQAPTAGNQTLYSIIDIQSQNIKDKLSLLCDNQPFIAKAPLVLVFVADCQRWYNIYNLADAPNRKPGLGDLMIACSDSIIAAQNSVVAAHSLGLGSCYIGDIMENHDQIKELLDLDDFVFPVCMVVYGYPTKQQRERQKPVRIGAQHITMVDKYTTQSNNTLKEMVKLSSGEHDKYDFYTYIDAFSRRKYTADFAKEMNLSVEKYFKNFY